MRRFEEDSDPWDEIEHSDEDAEPGAGEETDWPDLDDALDDEEAEPQHGDFWFDDEDEDAN